MPFYKFALDHHLNLTATIDVIIHLTRFSMRHLPL